MSALAEALVAAQRRALAQLEKAYIRAQDDDGERVEGFRESLTAIGLTDRVEADTLIACLEVLRVTGGALPVEPTNGTAPKADEPATDAQMQLVRKLAQEKNQPVPDPPLTKAQAHEVIDTLKAGTYDAGRWSVPF